MSAQNSSKDSKYDKEEAIHLRKLQKMKQRGRIELIMGPMFAGKSTELLRRVKRLEISGKKCLFVKYSADQRYSTNSISTHDQITRTAVSCKALEELGETWREYDVIGIDEGQFFDDLVKFSSTAANSGKIIITSALNGQFIQVGFPQIMELIPLCEKVKKLSSICKICLNTANYTFRTAKDSENLDDLIGGAEAYMPLCRECLEFKKAQKENRTNGNKVLHSKGI
jgi:thymidine kinase